MPKSCSVSCGTGASPRRTRFLRGSTMSYQFKSMIRCSRWVVLLFACALPSIPAVAQKLVDTATGSTGGGSTTVAGATTAAATNASSYVVGEADVLRINVWKQPELSQPSVVVRPDGMVSVPLGGEIKGRGMTRGQVERNL